MVAACAMRYRSPQICATGCKHKSPVGPQRWNVKKTSRRTPASRVLSRRSSSRTSSAHELALAAFADFAKGAALRWYLFGAQAVNVHGAPRATADVDITVDLAGDRVERFAAQLVKAGFDLRFADPAFLAASHVIPVVHRKSGLPIDIVLAGPGLEQQFLDEVEYRTVGRRKVPVLSLENLVVTKIIAGRPKDLEDVRALLARRGNTVDYDHVNATLAIVERALDVSDLRSRLRSLRPKR